MTGRSLADGLEFTCSVLRRHNGLKHDWYYEKDGLWARAEPIGSAAAQAAGSLTGGSQLSASHDTGRIDGTSAAVAATVSAATVATERAAAAATAANAAALATGKAGTTAPTAAASQASTAPASSGAPVRPAAADTASRERAAAAAPVATASSAASGAAAARPAPADPSIPYTSAASVRRPDRDDENRGGAPWLLWGAGAATLALAGLFMYKGMTVKPVEKVETQAAAVAPAAAPETKAAEDKPVVVAEAPAPAPEPTPAEEAPAAAAEPESPPPATEPGATSFYGVSDSSRVMAWSAEATFNPDYTTAAAEAPAEAPADAPVAQAEPEPAPAAPAAAEPEPAPVTVEPEPEPYKTEPGQTSYYGISEKADATQLWAAPATVFADAEPAPAPAPEPTSEPTPEAAPAPAAEEPAPVAAAEPEAEPYKTEPGVTSYYGIAEKADATQPWSAPATVYAEPEPAPAPAPEPAPVEAAAEPEPAAEPYKTEPGQTSFYGLALKPDATQAWAAPATVYAEAEPAAAPSPAANACSDALAAALKAGTLNFATSSWQILSNSYATLDEIAKQAKACEGVAIEVGGHTDSTGSAAGNKTLSERRANAVMNYLIKAGVPASSITAVGYGQDKPVATNDTADGKRQNRRIEFTVTSK